MLLALSTRIWPHISCDTSSSAACPTHLLSPRPFRQNDYMVLAQLFTSCPVIPCSSENAPFADMAATLIDSLSSLWMLGFRGEFQV